MPCHIPSLEIVHTTWLLALSQAVVGRPLQHVNGKHVEGVLGSPRRTRTYNLAVNPP